MKYSGITKGFNIIAAVLILVFPSYLSAQQYVEEGPESPPHNYNIIDMLPNYGALLSTQSAIYNSTGKCPNGPTRSSGLDSSQGRFPQDESSIQESFSEPFETYVITMDACEGTEASPHITVNYSEFLDKSLGIAPETGTVLTEDCVSRNKRKTWASTTTDPETQVTRNICLSQTATQTSCCLK